MQHQPNSENQSRLGVEISCVMAARKWAILSGTAHSEMINTRVKRPHGGSIPTYGTERAAHDGSVVGKHLN